MQKILSALFGALALLGSSAAGAAQIHGEYVEARTADVFTGPCFSNAEVFTSGNHAIMAWKVTAGTYQGEDLAGLGVAAAVEGTTTFSKDRPEQARAVLIVDQKANPRQRDALIALAKDLGGDRLANVIEIRSARIGMKIEPHSLADAEDAHASHGMPHAPRASFWAAGLAQILTRPLDDRDHFCGNEVVAYEPLSRGVDVLPAYTLGHRFKGEALNARWDDPNCRSSFVGHFAL